MKEIRSLCATGKRHIEAGLLCQDSVYSARNGTVVAIALSDGAGRDNWAAVGAKTTCMVAAQYCADHFCDLISKSEESIRFDFISNIRAALFHMSQDVNTSVKSFGATCIAVAVNKTTGEMLCIHLGDGCVLAQKETGDLQVISHPQNGISKTYTNLTTSFTGTDSIRIFAGTINSYSSILLASDGWFSESDTLAETTQRIMHYLECETVPRLFEDDISAISLSLK